MSFPLCKFFRSEQGCKFGNKCRYRHSDPSSFPAVNQSDHRQNQYDASIKKFDPAESFSHSQENFTVSAKYESSIRNSRYSENLPVHSYRGKESFYNEDQIRYTQRSSTAEAQYYLEEKFQQLEAPSHAEGTDFHSAQQPRPQRKICHYFARNGNCCFGSRCRFEHTQSPQDIPPRFQKEKTDSRHIQLSVSAESTAKREDQLNSSRFSNESIVPCSAASPLKARSSGTGSFKSANQKSSELFRENQQTGFHRDEEGTENRNEGRNPVPQNIKSDKICQFFVRGRCFKGRRCRFLHPRQHRSQEVKSAEEASHGAQHQQKETHSQNLPEQDKDHDSLQNTSTERPHTESSAKPPSVQKPRTTYVAQGTKKYRRDEVDDVEGSRLRRTEIEQMMKRFPKGKVKVNRDCAEYFQCIITFSPTDPDWPFDVTVFHLQVDIPSDYPFEMMTIIFPTDQELPETVRRYLEVSIEEWLGDKERQLEDSGQVELVFRPFLRWLDRNIEDIVTEGLKQLKREMVAKAAGLQFISAKELQKQYPAQSSDHDEDSDDNDDYETDSGSQDEDTSSDYDESDEEEDHSDEVAEEDQNEEKNRRKSQQDKVKSMMADPERRGTEVSLKNLQLKESAATLYFEKVCLLVQCDRCKATSEFMASPSRVNMVQCGQCSQTQTATYRPAMAHHFSAVVGYLDLDACLPYDLILQKCSTIVACMHCSKDTKSVAVVAGQPQDQWCRVCHHKLRVATDGVRFTQLEPSKTLQSIKGLVKVVVPTRKRIPKDPAIQEGKPLPNFGTCKHYKKSYRWLRFPCCGKCYPCDVCHDSKEDHEMTFANRMICGFCCKEQPYAAERPCKGCDMNMTRVHTKHWEGGQGCRDKITMCRNDRQKYRSSSKTVSKHAQKVKDMQSKKRTKLRHT